MPNSAFEKVRAMPRKKKITLALTAKELCFLYGIVADWTSEERELDPGSSAALRGEKLEEKLSEVINAT